MFHISPNYQSWCAIGLVPNMIIHNMYVNNIFCAIDKFDEKHIYLLVNNDGSQSAIEYINKLKSNNYYADEKQIGLDIILLKFNIPLSNQESYKLLIDGKYDKVDKKLNTELSTFIANCVRVSYEMFLPLYRNLFLIIDNSEQLLNDYWAKYEDPWLIEQIEKTGVFFSKVNTDLNNEYEMNIFNNYYKTYLN